eukprot:m.372909 g.372909  ORF g.372909 m.372909 type:complete len:672 (-) comp20879_c0_seq1:254-2269(-)
MATATKKGWMKKRAQGLSTFGKLNWKERWFELSRDEFSYWDKYGGAKEGGAKKGSVVVSQVYMVELVDEYAFPKETKEGVFQVGYFDEKSERVVLYIQAPDDNERSQWLDAFREIIKENSCLSELYHPKIWADKMWQCCNGGTRVNVGCEKTFFEQQKIAAAAQEKKAQLSEKQRIPSVRYGDSVSGSAHRDDTSSAKHTSVRTPSTGSHREPPLPPAPEPNPANGGAGDGLYTVVAVYPYNAAQSDDLHMAKGDVFTVLDDTEPNWWLARSAQGLQGHIPSNYVKKQEGILAEPWFHGKMGRSEAAALLRQTGTSGTFLVRESESKVGEYSLSVTHETVMKHYHIKKAAGEFWINERHRFPTIQELIEYHRLNSGGLITRLRKSLDEASAPPTAGFGHGRWEIPKSQISLGKLIGEGNWGKVYLATYLQNNQAVAVKTLKQCGSIEQDDFIAEAKVMMECCHSHLVQLYGVSSDAPMYIITEYMSNGCLLDYLRNEGLPAETLHMMGVDVASGMSYLEQRQFIHRDLAARNCLVGDNSVVKVGDFGLARFVLDDEYTASEGTKFPVKWAAPEVINFNRFSTKSDVWSFGIILWEIWSRGRKPYPGMDNLTVMDKVSDGYRMGRPEEAPHNIHDIMCDCWHADPDSRPSFEELFRILDANKGEYVDDTDVF